MKPWRHSGGGNWIKRIKQNVSFRIDLMKGLLMKSPSFLPITGSNQTCDGIDRKQASHV